jgi:peptidoglycan hydrolase-like protein with peptidoglycan-binding domain
VVTVNVNGVPATPTPTTPTPAVGNQYQAVGTLTAEQKEVADDNGILATPENVAAFMAEAKALEAQIPVGPGSVDTQAITELQQLLSGWGYPVTATGTFDAATEAAVLKFKRDNNLFATYKLADGSQALHPYIDEATKQFMIKKLGG